MTGEILVAILAGIPWTLALTALSLLTGAVLGAGLCAMRVSAMPVSRLLAAIVIITVRSIPPIVWLFLIVFGTAGGAVGPFWAAATGLGLIAAANMAEIYRGALSAVHTGQWEAAAALNLPARSRLLDVIGPQLLRVALPSAASFAIGLLKDSAIASTIGVGEVAFEAQHVAQRSSQGLEVFAFAGALYIALSLPLAVAARRADLVLRARVAG